MNAFDIHINYPESGAFAVLWIIAAVLVFLGIVIEIWSAAIGDSAQGGAIGTMFVIGVIGVGIFGSGITQTNLNNEAESRAITVLEQEQGWDHIEISGEDFTAESKNGEYLTGNFIHTGHETYTIVVR